MNRRAFLTRGALAVAALAIDPERLVWIPGQKTYFLPALRAGGKTSLSFAQIVAVTYEQVVLRDSYMSNRQWADTVLLTELERMGAVRSVA